VRGRLGFAMWSVRSVKVMKSTRLAIATATILSCATVLAVGVAALHTASRNRGGIHTYNRQDAALVERVQAAVRDHIRPNDIESLVGAEATVNTWRPELAFGTEFVDMAGDPPKWAPPIKIHSAKHVMAWPRPVQLKDRLLRMVGIMWDEEDNEAVFAGALLPNE